jgi:apolipoprotein N-acyltransferase
MNPDPAGPIRVALVQPNIPQEIKWDPAALDGIMQGLARQTTQAALLKPDLIVWPEASAPLVLDYSPHYLNMVRQLATGAGTHLLVGSLSPVLKNGDPATRNSAYLYGPDGLLVDQAAKQHLVPFGEYVPLESLLPFVRKLTHGIGDLIPGAGTGVLEHPRGGAGLAVCYELIFPGLVRQRFVDGAGFLVTITNDAWFGASAAPYQHFANAVFRAVENRTYVVRSANTGISGMVDPYGIVQARSELNAEAVVAVAIQPRTGIPFYSRHGDLFALLCGLLSVAALLRAGVRSRQRTPRPAQPQDEADD